MPLVAANWNYHERTSRHQLVISDWLQGLSKKAQAKFERHLDQLKQLPKQSWHKPHPASNIGDHTYVIRFNEVTGAQLRVYGHFCDSHSAFVMTFEGYEKDDVYYPCDYEKVAQRYRQACDKNLLGTTVQYRSHCALCTANASVV